MSTPNRPPDGSRPTSDRPTASDDRSPLAIAMEWSSTVTTISIEMVVPGLVGYWVDQRLGTAPLLLVIGMALGVPLGIWQLVRITQRKGDGNRRR